MVIADRFSFQEIIAVIADTRLRLWLRVTMSYFYSMSGSLLSNPYWFTAAYLEFFLHARMCTMRNARYADVACDIWSIEKMREGEMLL